MITVYPCETCERVYGESRHYGGSHWHCGNCALISGCQGHYKKLDSGEYGFSCEEEE